MKQIQLFTILLIVLFLPISLKAETKILAYQGFTIWLSCEHRGAIKFVYNVDKDRANLRRVSKFFQDTKVPERCRQSSTKSYNSVNKDYDRGQLVPSNHVDHLLMGIKQSNLMTNILPQTQTMNLGAWLRTEEIIECYRDKEPLTIYGGVIWGENSSDDYFLNSHGVATPDSFWKVIIAKSNVIAWIVPNNNKAKRNRLDEYIVSVKELETRTGETIPVPDQWKSKKASSSWKIPKGCDES